MQLVEKIYLQFEGMKPSTKKLIFWFIHFFRIEKILTKLPTVRKQLDHETDQTLGELAKEQSKKFAHLPQFPKLPEVGRDHDAILEMMKTSAKEEEKKWRDGFCSGSVYHGGAEHIDFLNKVYALHSQTNPLHMDIWPTLQKYESEIIQMTASILGHQKGKDEICGQVTSGGTESIMLAMKTYRDYARDKKNITNPEIIIPVSAHAAFDKSCQYFGIKKIEIPVDNHGIAITSEVRKKINRNTICIVGSSPSFPHGVIDPIEELSELAYKHKIGFHTDACLGGFLLAFAPEKYNVPLFDFRLRGVTSISIDTHKYGHASKGTSVIMYRTGELRQYQYYVTSTWPGGLYFSPTFAGSRPGALIAQCWAAMVTIGEAGYKKYASEILEVAEWIKSEMRSLPEVQIIGNPLWVIAFQSNSLNIYTLMEYLTKKGWSLNGLHRPAALHICLTRTHTHSGVKERFITDLKEAIEYAKGKPLPKDGLAPIYGMASALPFPGTISKMLKKYVETLYPGN